VLLGRASTSRRPVWKCKLTSDELQQLETAIYEAAIVPEQWASVLGAITAVCGAAGGVFFGVSTVATSWIASEGLRTDMAEFVASGWAAKNSRMQIGLAKGLHYTPRFVTEADYYTAEELDQEAIYNEFFYPKGYGHSAGTIAILPHEDLLCFSFERRRDHGPFDPTQLVALDALRPHLMRASLVTARLGMEQIRTAMETLTAVGLPAAAVSETGRVIETNAGFAAADQVWTTKGQNRIALIDSFADGMLRDALANLKQMQSNRSIPVRQEPGGAMSAVVQVVPLHRLALDIFGNTAAILVLSRPKTDQNNASLLLSLFDLTAAELDVAKGLAAGLTVKQIAANKGRSVATIRNQLRNVMAKTGSSRQADLIILLNSLTVRG
jgi:DNA-binding CsgD family transcriptional regulator